MREPVRVIGSHLSPYVRKLLVVLHVKGVEYRIDPIVPFYGDDRFAAASPLRRVPVYIDARTTLCDSSVICQYLEDTIPEPSMYDPHPGPGPARGAAERRRAALRRHLGHRPPSSRRPADLRAGSDA